MTRFAFFVCMTLSLLVLGCSAAVEFSDGQGRAVQSTGKELCGLQTAEVKVTAAYGTVTAESARQTVARSLAASRTGLRLVDVSDRPDLIIDVWMSDETACFHCPQNYNYVAWLLVMSRAGDGAFVASAHHYGWKLVGSPKRGMTRAIRLLRRGCPPN